MKRIIFVSLLFAFVCSAHAQMFIPTVKKIRLSYISFDAGKHSERFLDYLSMDELKKLAPNSNFLNHDFTNYYTGDWNNDDKNRSFSLQAGVKILNKKSKEFRNMTMQLGCSYYSEIYFRNNIYSDSEFVYDSTVSAGQTTYYDSLISRGYDAKFQYGQLRIDGSLLFNYKPMSQVSFFGGIGLSFGISTHPYMVVHSDYSWYNEIIYPNGQTATVNNYTSNGLIHTEINSVKSNYTTCLFLPLGIDIKLGMQNNFFKHLHVFAEARPGIAMTIFPKVVTLKYKCLQDGVGIKYSW